MPVGDLFDMHRA